MEPEWTALLKPLELEDHERFWTVNIFGMKWRRDAFRYNRRFTNYSEWSFVTTHSIKKFMKNRKTGVWIHQDRNWKGAENNTISLSLRILRKKENLLQAAAYWEVWWRPWHRFWLDTHCHFFPEVQDISADDSKPLGAACGKYISENISFQQETTEWCRCFVD